MKTKLLLLCSMLISIIAFSQESTIRFWSNSDAPYSSTALRIKSKVYLLKHLNVASFKAKLPTAHKELSDRSNTSTVVIEIPTPNGGEASFRVQRSQLMEPGLEAKFPEIRTFRGQGITDPQATIVLDYNLNGVHAMVLTPAGDYFIDPAITGNTTDYIVYYKKDLIKTFIFEEGKPITVNQDEPAQTAARAAALPNAAQNVTAINCPGTSLRKYRMAIACTGEYAVAATGVASPTVAQTLSCIQTTFARVVGVYEKELAITMVLVANENAVIFTNASTDPFTGNNNANTLITESQTVIDKYITDANYDVGHTFSTGGGGLSDLGVICASGAKASSITGSPTPTGDGYDIDYVAHEMGHAFGANHTFNDNSNGSCSGNYNNTTNNEPGSGSTIMAYAGICTGDDLQPHSDPYFTAMSFNEIEAYNTTGSGKSCAVNIATTNHPPVVALTADYTIPYKTPFVLTGSATDPDGDSLTYCWEQVNVGGTACTWNAPRTTSKGDAPIFRSFNPVKNNYRIFPKLSAVIQNKDTIGELKPTYARTLKFRLTARDNKSGGGGVCYNENNVIVAAVTDSFWVKYPTASTTVWTTGRKDSVNWNVTGTNVAPINCKKVAIDMSIDGGYTYPYTLVDSTPNTGSCSIIVPNIVSSTVRVRVRAVGNIFFAISKANYKIVFGATPVTNTAICSNQLPYTWNGNTFTSAGSYTIHFTALGHDSAAILNLTVNQPSASTTYDTVFSSNLPFKWNGTSYITGGTYVVHLKNAAGCDSAATLMLKVNSTVTNTINLTGCNSVTYKSVVYTNSVTLRDTVKTKSGTDSIYNITNITVYKITAQTNPINITGCNSATYKGVVYTNSTVIKDTLKSYQGCDSLYNVVTITVARIRISNINSTLTGCNSVVYKGIVYYYSTNFIDTIRSVQGCDSVYNNVVVTINVPVAADTSIAGCSSAVYKGVTYNVSTFFIDTIKSVQGCDSFYYGVNITVSNIIPTTSNFSLTGCDSVIYHSKIYFNSTIVNDTTKSVLGCDSVFNTVNITINTSPRKDTFATACNYFYWNGTFYSNDTVVTVHKPNYVYNSIYNGIDNGMTAPAGWTYNNKVRAYTGGIIPPPNTPYGGSPPSLVIDSANLLITSPLINGIITSVSFWLRSDGPATNCINIDGYDGNTWSQIGSFCGGGYNPGQVFNFTDTSHRYYLPYGKQLSQIRFETDTTRGFYDVFELDDITINYKTAIGCDTLETLHLKLFKPSARTINISGCNVVSYKGKLYTKSTSFADTLKYINGCDSLYTTNNITVYKLTPTTNTTTLSGCGSVIYKSVAYTTSTNVSDTVRSSNGCDSIYNIANITVSPLLMRDTIATSCGGINWYGNNYTKDTIATHQKTNFFNLSVNEGFNAGSTAPTGWTFTTLSGTYTSAGNYGLASPSLKFGKTGDQIITATLPYAATQLSFWLKNQGSSGSTLVVEGYNGTKWVKVDSISYFPTTGTTSMYNATSTPALPVGLKQFRFTYTKSTGNISLDDVSMLYSTGSGCDSLITLHLSIIKAITVTNNLSGCVVTYKGIKYYNNATFIDTVKSLSGCDSIYNTTNITINKISTSTDTIKLISSDSIIYKGTVYKASTSFIDTVKTNQGCDSIYHVVNVVININNFSVAGNIIYPNNKPIPTVNAYLTGSVNLTQQATGYYSFNSIASGANCTTRLSKNNDVNKTNGITAVDIAFVQSNILGKNLFNSPYKLIAADVNGDGKVTALDIVYIKRMILGIDTTFTNSTTKQNRLWAFVDSSYKFADVTNPFPYKDSISYTGLSVSKTNQTFIGCKLGDVNWDWNPAIPKPTVNNTNAVELSYSLESPSVRPCRASDGYIHIPVKVKNFKEMLGMQFTISYDPTVMQWQGIGNNTLGIETGTNHAAEGSVTFLWVDAKNTIKTLEDGTVLMELVFKSIDNGKLIIDNENTNTLKLDGSVTAIAAYDKDYGLYGVELKRLEDVQPKQAESWTVAPNPTKDGVIKVQMNLNDKKMVVFRLLDNTGRLLLTKQVEGIKGSNNITLREGENIPTGTYYLQAVGVEGVKQLIIDN